jgi:hypothetical protein
MKPRHSLGIERPLSSVWVAAVLLNCGEHRVHQYIEDGKLPLAFDISQPGAARATIRVALPNVLELRRGRKRSGNLSQFMASALPMGMYRAPEVAWALQCDYDFVYKLVRKKALENVGSYGRYLIPRASIVAFLKKRKIG